MRFLNLIKICAVLLCLATIANAKAIPPRPHNSYVYDENRILNANETHAFNTIAQELYNKTGVGIAAAIFQDIEGEDFRDFAVSIAESWKIGSKGKDGILIFVTLNEKRRSVEVGYSVEAILPDALVERIQQQTLVPQFRQGNYAQGILSLEYELSQKIADHYNVELQFKGKRPQEQAGHISPFHFVLLILALAFFLGTPIGRQILLYMLLSGILRGGGGGGHGGRGGGFGGGFGGGSFGGGGSGGSW